MRNVYEFIQKFIENFGNTNLKNTIIIKCKFDLHKPVKARKHLKYSIKILLGSFKPNE